MPRKVCWPDPDIVCADGGCSFCESSKVRKGVLTIATAVGGIPCHYIWRGGNDSPGRIPGYYYGAERVPYRYPRSKKRIKEYETAQARGLVRWRDQYGYNFDDLDC